MSMECIENGIVGKDAELTNGSSTEIIVVRHGETEWNALGKMQVRLFLNEHKFVVHAGVNEPSRTKNEPGLLGSARLVIILLELSQVSSFIEFNFSSLMYFLKLNLR